MKQFMGRSAMDSVMCLPVSQKVPDGTLSFAALVSHMEMTVSPDRQESQT